MNVFSPGYSPKIYHTLWLQARHGMSAVGLDSDLKPTFAIVMLYVVPSQIAKFMGPTWGPPGSCWPEMGTMLVPWTSLSGMLINWPLGDVVVISKVKSSNTCYGLCSWLFPVKLFSGECHWKLLMKKSTLILVTAWCCQARNHYLSQCWPRSMSPYEITKTQWVNSLRLSDAYMCQ